MRRLINITILATLVLASCAHKIINPEGNSVLSCEYESMQTRAQGIAASQRDLTEKGFRILRYDDPLFLSGNVDSVKRNFKHFGIEYFDEFHASLDYCRAYNAEMDRQLLKRYGSEYRRLRSKILPKPSAGRLSTFVLAPKPI